MVGRVEVEAAPEGGFDPAPLPNMDPVGGPGRVHLMKDGERAPDTVVLEEAVGVAR